MLRVSLKGLAVAIAGLTSMGGGLVNQAFATTNLIWVEPVSRDSNRTWGQKPSRPDGSGKRSPAQTKDSGKPRGAGSSSRERQVAQLAAHAGGPQQLVAHDGQPQRLAARGEQSQSPAQTRGKKEKKPRSYGGERNTLQALVKAGNFPLTKSGPTDPDLQFTEFWLELPDNQIVAIDLKKTRGRYQLEIPAETGGNYRLIGYNRNRVEAGSLLHRYSFYNFMRHGDAPDTMPRDMSYRRGFDDGRPTLEIVRLYDRERERYRSQSGQEARIRVLYKGEPVANAPVTLKTSDNWQKRVITDDNGEAHFTLIKDVFQDGVFDKRKSTIYLFETEYVEDIAGHLGGIGYDREAHIATLSFQVFPDSNEWESKRIAFIIVLFTAVIAGAAIALHRSRRRNRA